MDKKVSDLVAEFLAEHPDISNDVFLVSGGGNMHLIDSVGRNEKLRYTCNHHEQACTFAAEGYARISNRIGVAVVTTGPGGTNAITGVYGAWTDSIPMLVISGQVKRETTISSHPHLHLRQLGDQEVDIVPIVEPITKYAVTVIEPHEILYHLEKAVYYAKEGRPGPVWVDIPLDVQGAVFNTKNLRHFTPPGPPIYRLQTNRVVTALRKAKRPVIIAGNGIRLAEEKTVFLQLIETLQIPVLTAISGIDLLPSKHPLFFGRPGILGDRAANFIVQNSDLLLVLGTRMNLRLISFNWEHFARNAYKIMVDIDENELEKRTFTPDLKVHADLSEFLPDLQKKIQTDPLTMPSSKWIKYCQKMKQRYNVIKEMARLSSEEYVSSYLFPGILQKYLQHPALIVTGNGTAYTSTYQSIEVHPGDRVFANIGCASMGYDLPAAIGAAVASGKEVVCLTGDGSIQMNLQELQTIIHYRLPIKIFMYNNRGYLSIRITQGNYFADNFVGEGENSGVSIPDMLGLAKVYGFSTFRITNNAEAEEKMATILNEPGPVFCEVMLSPHETLGPKVSSYKKEDGTIISKPLEDLAPFLPREEFRCNMIIPPIEEK
jgi:acetolactate synthase-1/2/3 large subunit